MALRKCPEPECRLSVSTKAEICPHCGCPLDSNPLEDLIGDEQATPGVDAEEKRIARVAEHEKRVGELRAQLTKLAPTKLWQNFGEWHKVRFGGLLSMQFGLLTLVILWVFYGFLWIPMWYLLEQVISFAPRQPQRQAEAQRIEAELRSLGVKP
jgi:hypothetical protein